MALSKSFVTHLSPEAQKTPLHAWCLCNSVSSSCRQILSQLKALLTQDIVECTLSESVIAASIALLPVEPWASEGAKSEAIEIAFLL